MSLVYPLQFQHNWLTMLWTSQSVAMVITLAPRLEQALIELSFIILYFCLITLSMLRISVSQPAGLVWVQLATLFDGIVERPFFRKEIPRGTSTTQGSDVIPSGVSEDSQWPFGVSSDEEWWVNNVIPSSSNRWGSAIEEWAGETA